jgi:hypothetical protein
LPWLPGIPDRLATDPNGGPYLNARSQLVAELADQVRSNAAAETAAWAAQRHAPVPAELIADIQVWRAATEIDPSDLRPTGPPQLGRAARVFQLQLDKRLAAEVPSATADPFLPELAERLSYLTRAGFDAALLVRWAAAAKPLPDDHPCAALWWRIVDRLAREMPNQDSAIHNAVPATTPTRRTSQDKLRAVPRSTPPPALGPSR